MEKPELVAVKSKGDDRIQRAWSVMMFAFFYHNLEERSMSYNFYRKERPNIFLERISFPEAPVNAYTLKSSVIFQAKNVGQKIFQVDVAGKKYNLIAQVSGTELLVTSNPNKLGEKTKMLRFSEANVTDILRNNDKDSLYYQIAKKLCKDHATSSASSPLISGCTVNNFGASITYPGYKLHLKLRCRQPFENPFVSGNEKEAFLIGNVAEADCEVIVFLGETSENVNQLVNPSTSRIPRPS
jgi:hypothetical protein